MSASPHPTPRVAREPRARVVARRADLPDLSVQLRRLQRRRRRRSARHHGAARARRLARRRRDLAVAVLHVADEGLRLRHLRLSQRRSALRLARRLRPAGRARARARTQGHHRPGVLAHFRSARVVPRESREPRQSARGLVRVGGRATRTARRRATGSPCSAVRPGPGTRAAGSTTCTTSSPSSRT